MGKSKNSPHSLPCYFLVNGLLYCPSASLSVGEDKHRQWTPMWHGGFKTSLRPRWLGWQSRPRSSLSVVYCTCARSHPHTLWLPHRSDQNCLLPYEGQFPRDSLLKKIDTNDSNSGGLWALLQSLCVGKHWFAKTGNVALLYMKILVSYLEILKPNR